MKCRIVLDLKNEPKENDILVFDGKQFVCVNKDYFLRFIKNEVKDALEKVDNLSVELDKVKKDVNVLKGEE